MTHFRCAQAVNSAWSLGEEEHVYNGASRIYTLIVFIGINISVFTGTLLWLCPQTMDIYSLLSTVSSGFVLRVLSHSLPSLSCGSAPLRVFALWPHDLLLASFQNILTGSRLSVAVSLSRSGHQHPYCWITRWELGSGGQQCLWHPPPGLIGSGPSFSGSCDPWETRPWELALPIWKLFSFSLPV